MTLKDFNTLIKAKQPLLIYFYADWCEPCKILDNVLDELKPRFKNKITVHKIDIDESPEITGLHSIKSVPVLMVFKEGTIQWRINGFMWADELAEKVLGFV